MLKWWQERVVYQIYPRSFMDSNGDGFGDLPGIISKLDTLADLGIGAIWLSPVYSSPDVDNGYDISDYRAIDPRYGTMADMDTLIREAGARDIKIIMDLVINHTSDKHSWFQASRNPNSPYRDWYIWRPGKNGKLPNNWTSFFAEDCWELDPTSGEYYLHLFAKAQPDLNWSNPAVLDEMQNIMRFWLDKGVAGFRCDVINILCKSSLKDGRKKLILTGSEHYLSQEGTHEILRRLRADVLDHYDAFTVGETVFVTPSIGQDLCNKDRKELDIIFAFEHMETDQWIVKWFSRPFHAGKFAKAIDRWQHALEWNALYLENHDQPRSVSRFGDDKNWWHRSATLLATLLLTLRGTPFIYQGQELGMCNFDFTNMDSIRDVESINVDRLLKKLKIPGALRWSMIRQTSRDNARTPMQWSSAANAGFSSGEPWLAVNANHTHINMESQQNDPTSVRSWYKSLIHLRANTPVLLKGSYRTIHISRHLFIYIRELEGHKPITVLLNFSGKTRRHNIEGTALTSNCGSTNYTGTLQPWEALLLL